MNKSIYTSYSKFLLPEVLIILLLTTYSMVGQNGGKKVYTPDLDSLWSHNTVIQKMSPNGDWITYIEMFDHKENILTLQNTSNSLAHTFKNSNIVEFSKNSQWFGGITGNQKLVIIDLIHHTQKVYPDVLPQLFYFSPLSDYLTAYQKGKDGKNNLLIINLKNQKVSTLAGVTDYQWHPLENKLLVVQELETNMKVIYYDVRHKQSILIEENKNSKYSSIKWSGSGSAVIFMEEQQGNNLLHYWSPKGKLQSLNTKKLASLEKGCQVSNKDIFISSDGKKILFHRQRREDIKEPKGAVEVWDTDDPWIYPRMQYYKETELRYLLTAWYPDTNELVAIETEQTPTSALDIDHDYALLYNQLDYEPLYKSFPNVDLYVKNMKTRKTRLVCKNQYIGKEFIKISPDGKYVSYFKDNDWWVYSIQKDKIVNLTENMPLDFQNTEMERAGDLFPYGNPGWLVNDSYIVLYDKFDIWIMSPNGKVKNRITRGREQNIRCRISKEIIKGDFHNLTVNQSFASAPFNTKIGILLEMFDYDNYKTGYALWQKNNSVITLVFEDLKFDNVLGVQDPSTIVYRKQRFNKPIGIYSLNLTNHKENLLYQSNELLLDYDLGKAEIIKYTSPEGKPLKGALVYPTNYNPDNKYPMIVQIYEKKSIEVLKFAPPSDYEMGGFNLLRYTTNDYFVFYPDFTYTIGDPGISALGCLISGVKKVLETGKVDKERIGLIGHSFGGYETAFIVTQTDMFAGAVAGAAATDLINWYHDISWNFKMPQLWRMENQQLRMGTSFYNNKEAYYRNSPIQHIERVKTPLLFWTGKLDANVNWTQSINMFIGLKRLNKKAKMLLFDKEAHAMLQKKNQQILSHEIFNWMEEYVKKRDNPG